MEVVIAHFHSAWHSLIMSPIFSLGLTLAVFAFASKCYAAKPNWHFLNPVLVSIVVIISVLLSLDIPYAHYFEGAYSLHLLLGPATVALAVPLYQQLSTLKTTWFAVLIAVAGGSLVGIAVTVATATFLGAEQEVVVALSLRSITTPIAMALSGDFGADPTLTAIMVMLTGVMGASICSWLFTVLDIKDEQVRGVAIGTGAHAIGTARAFQLSSKTGAFSGLAMMVAGVFTALVMPWLVRIF